MKYVLCAALLAVLLGNSYAWGSVVITERNFPDKVFREYIRAEFDTDGDGVLTNTETSTVTKIDVANRSITSLKGIDYFSSLVSLSCSNNNLPVLDLSNNTALTDLDCGHQNVLIDFVSITNDAQYPYSLNFDAVNEYLDNLPDIYDFASRIHSLEISGGSDANITYRIDYQERTIYFSGLPSSIKYYYDTKNTGNAVYMDVEVTVAPGVPEAVIKPVDPDTQESLRNIITEVMQKGDIIFADEDNITPAPDLTPELAGRIKSDDYRPICPLNTIQVNGNGWYVFRIELPYELFRFIEDANVNDITVYALHARNDTDTPTADAEPYAVEFLTLGGKKFTTFTSRKFLMIGFFNADMPLSLYLVRALPVFYLPPMQFDIADDMDIEICGGTGCNSGLGFMGNISVLFLMFHKRH